MRLRFAVAFALACLPLAVACSSTSPTSSTSSSSSGGEPSVEDAGGKATDASDASSVDPGTCEGTCKVTEGIASFGGKQVTFERANFGLDGDAGSLLRAEAYVGGVPGCPTADSKDPDQLLVVAGIPRGAAGKSFTKADGVAVSLFDFKGNLLATPKPASATEVTVTVRAQDPSASPQWVAFDVQASFGGNDVVKAGFYATRCTSLD